MKRGAKPEISVCDLLLLNVCPLGLGIEDIHGHMHILVPRYTPIPVRTEFYPIFTNAYAYQKTAIIRLFEGEHRLTKYNVRIECPLFSRILFFNSLCFRYVWANLVCLV